MNPYQKYKEVSVENMSPAELLVLLYDEAIKDLKKAQIAVEDRDWDYFEERLNRLTQINRYLINTLDMSQPIAKDLRRLYDYINFDIGRCKAGRLRQQAELQGMIDIFQDLRDGFEEAGKMTNDTRIPDDNNHRFIV